MIDDHAVIMWVCFIFCARQLVCEGVAHRANISMIVRFSLALRRTRIACDCVRRALCRSIIINVVVLPIGGDRDVAVGRRRRGGAGCPRALHLGSERISRARP